MKIKLLIIHLFSVLLLALSPNYVLAQLGPDGGCGQQSVYTAIGCIPVLEGSFALSSFFLVWGMGIGGGMAFLLVIYAGFMIMSSTGNPQRLSAGKELITAALSGLLLIVFAAFILRVIGVDVLGLFPQ